VSEDPSSTRILVSNEQRIPVNEKRIAAVARRTLEAENAAGEVSITLVEADRMAEMNSRYLGEDGPTDVLSFPIDDLESPAGKREAEEAPLLIGEVVLCPEVAGQASSLEAELDLLTAHGILHLLGYDHSTAEAAARMRSRERLITGRAGARAT